MNIAFESSFARDLKRVRSKQLFQQVQKIIEQVKAAPTMRDIPNLKKMQGYATFYRIRLRDYRIGLEIVGDQVIFVRILHRKDVYRYFP
jgi:mRNA interferase RelE/StbE